MKKLLYILTAIAAVFMYACEPQMDVAPDIGAAPTGDITIDNSDPNNIKLSAPAGYLYRWEFFGAAPTSHLQTVTVNYPFVGDYKVKLVLSGKGGATDIEKTINITTHDPAVGQKPVLKELTGGGAGKTWVYADDNPDGQGYCYMVANYDWDEFWWFPYEGGDGPSPDFDGELIFDLNGGYNFKGVDGNSASFILDEENMIITFVGDNILDWDEANCNPDATSTGIYTIKSITDDELVLWQFQDNNDYDWIWRFKRKGYTYPTK